MLRSILLVLFGSCSYGVLSTFVKFAYRDGFPVGHVVGSQMVFGALIQLGLLGIFGRGRGGASRRQLALLFAVGLPIGLTGTFYYASLQYVGAAVAVILLFQFTWLGVLVEAVVDRRWPPPVKLASLLLVLGGTVLASGLLGGAAGPIDPRGLGLGLLSAVSYTAFVYASGRAEVAVQPWLRSAVMVLGSVTIVMIIFPPVFLIDGSLRAGLLPWGLLLAIFGPVIPTLSFNVGVPHLGPGLASILGAIELPTVILLSTLVLHEQVGALQWLGTAVILFGTVLPELARRRAAARVSP